MRIFIPIMKLFYFKTCLYSQSNVLHLNFSFFLISIAKTSWARTFLKFKTIFLDIHVPVDFHTQKPRGFAYIEYEDVNDAITAREALQALVINGKEISVQYAFGDRKSWF